MTKIHTTISMTEGRRRFFEIAEEVQSPGVAYTLTADGKPRVVVVSAAAYEHMVGAEKHPSRFAYTRSSVSAGYVSEPQEKQYGTARQRDKKKKLKDKK